MKKNSFMEGAVIATLAIIFSKIIGVLYVIPFYDIIGTKGGALYGYAYTIYNTFLIISSAGIPLAISKITSEYETKKEYKKKEAMFTVAKRLIAIFAIISFLLCFLFAKPLATLIIGDLVGGNTISDVTFVIRCVSFALLIVPILSISRGYLQGHKYITPSSLSQVIEQIVRIAIILIGSYICINKLGIPVTYAVGISVLSAGIGAAIAYIYLHKKMKAIKSSNNIKYKEISKDTKKEVIKKIIGYSIPFVVVNIANNIYNTTDMILLIKGLNILGYSANDIETISSIFTTWGTKLISIVTAFATGLVISLIPSMVAAYTAKNEEEVNLYFNKTLQVLLFIILPLTIFMSIFASQIWQIFYGNSFYGPIIFRFTILVAFLDSAYIMICCALQALYKTKLIYIAVIAGLLTNIILDLPLILLFDKLKIYPFYGAITATIIGYTVSLAIPLISLKRKDNFNYRQTIKTLPKLFMSLLVLIITTNIFKHFIPTPDGIIKCIFYLGIQAMIAFGIFYLINYKFINQILGDKINKLLKK